MIFEEGAWVDLKANERLTGKRKRLCKSINRPTKSKGTSGDGLKIEKNAAGNAKFRLVTVSLCSLPRQWTKTTPHAKPTLPCLITAH